MWHTIIMFITCTWDMCAHDHLLQLATLQPPMILAGFSQQCTTSTIQLHFCVTITTTQSLLPPPSSHGQVHCWQWKPEPWELDKVPTQTQVQDQIDLLDTQHSSEVILHYHLICLIGAATHSAAVHWRSSDVRLGDLLASLSFLTPFL